MLRPEHPPHHHQLPEVIGVVIDGQDHLAQRRLAVAMRERLEQIDRLIARNRDKCIEIAAVRGDAPVPRRVVRRYVVRRPVDLRKLGRHMLRVARELEDVRQRDAQVLQQLPRGVGTAGGTFPPQLRGEVLHRIVESDVRVLAIEKRNQLLAKYLLVHFILRP
jgi:hypothetical protein